MRRKRTLSRLCPLHGGAQLAVVVVVAPVLLVVILVLVVIVVVVLAVRGAAVARLRWRPRRRRSASGGDACRRLHRLRLRRAPERGRLLQGSIVLFHDYFIVVAVGIASLKHV